MDLLNQEQNQNQEGETTNTLAEILGSINTEVSINDVNLVNYVEEEKTNNININLQETQEMLNLSTQVQLLTDTIDRRIGNYLLNELEKKQAYIDELEEAVKFQEKEISELKSKLEGINKLELLSKIKSNMETKLVEVETNLHQVEVEELSGNYEVNSGAPENNFHSFLGRQETSFKPKVLSVKKSNQQAQTKIVRDEEQTQYPRSNQDLVFRSDPGTKVKSIPKEEEEPRYNGIIMLDKPKNETQIKIQLDYETEIGGDNSSSMSDVLKQRRRRAGRL
jgi:hypothetical protein